MIGNRDLSIEDYLAILRRRLKVIVVPMLLASFGWLIDFLWCSPAIPLSIAGTSRGPKDRRRLCQARCQGRCFAAYPHASTASFQPRPVAGTH